MLFTITLFLENLFLISIIVVCARLTILSWRTNYVKGYLMIDGTINYLLPWELED